MFRRGLGDRPRNRLGDDLHGGLSRLNWAPMSGDFQIGEWQVQPAVNRVRRRDHVVRLEPKVMQVLVCLAESAGEVVTREQLIARVWPDVFVTDDVLHRAIRELRRVFGDSTATPTYIETIRKRGYRLIPTSIPTPPPVDLGLSTKGSVPLSGRQTPWADARAGQPLGRAPRQPPAVTSPASATSPAFALLAAGVAVGVVAAVVIVATRTDDLASQAHARFVPVVSGPLNESDPAMSPDGRSIAFVQRETGDGTSADIYIRNLADGRLTRLTAHPASERLPAWSPDGARLAYVRTTGSSCDIFIRTLATSVDVRIAPCGNAEDGRLAWTADGHALLTSHAPKMHADSGWRITRIEIATGATLDVTDPPKGSVGDHSPTVSPDGRQIAFIRRASGGVSDIYVAAADGSGVKRLTFDDVDLTGLDWSGDGRSIVYSSDRAGGYSLWRIPADGGQPTLLAGGAARMKHPVADRAGRRVVYENWNYEINVWQVGRAGTDPSPITTTSELWNLYPQVSPDGRHIAYVSTQSGAHELWIADRDGGNPRQITRLAGGVVKAPRWSPDSRRVVYLARGRGSVDVQHADIATGLITQVTSSSTNEVAPSWSHDGTRILYGAVDEHANWNVWSVDLHAASPARVEITNAVAAQSAADGASLYFTRPDQPGIWRTVPHSPRTADRLLENVAAGNTLGWAIANDAIYFIAEQNDEVHLRRAALDGSGGSDVATLSQFTWPGFSVAPDGAILYARWERRDSNLMAIEY